MDSRGTVVLFLLLFTVGIGGIYLALSGLDTKSHKEVSTSGLPELAVLTWEEYIDPEIIEEFEAAHGVRVRFVHYQDDQDRDERLEANGTRGFDLVLVNEQALMIYRKKGWIAPLSLDEMPNLAHIDPTWFERYPVAHGYTAPYFWGTTGIIYRRDMLPHPLTGWKDLFDPPFALRGKLQMPRDQKELVGPALQALGYSMYSDRLVEYDEARRLLLRQQPYVRHYGTPVLSGDALIVQGEVAAAVTYSGDAMMLQEQNENLEYVIPKEGSSLWMDFFIVMMSSSQKELAYRLLDYLNEPEVAARNAEYVYYATPNLTAKQHVSSEYLENPMIFPDAEVLARSESFTILPVWISRQIERMFVDLLPSEE